MAKFLYEDDLDLGGPGRTVYAAPDFKTGTNYNTRFRGRDTRKPKISSVQQKYRVPASKNTSHDSVDAEELEKYIDKVEKKYHQARKQEWEKAYREQYRTKYPKGGQYGPKI
jgi:hypothetical protein